jgi:hypothetical protein
MISKTKMTTERYMNGLWRRINDTRSEFKRFISYEYNYSVHINFHKNYNSTFGNVDKLIRRYFKYIRKKHKLTFSAFYLVPKSKIDSVYNPPHVHILFLVFNSNSKTESILKDSALGNEYFVRCIVQQLSEPDGAISYLVKNKNLKLTDMDSVHFDFYRESLLKKYRNESEFLNRKISNKFE